MSTFIQKNGTKCIFAYFYPPFPNIKLGRLQIDHILHVLFRDHCETLHKHKNKSLFIAPETPYSKNWLLQVIHVGDYWTKIKNRIFLE